MIRVNWSPTTAEEVVQNVKTIIATETGSVPLARDLGTPQDIVDAPTSIAGARLQASIIKAVRTYESRAEITAVRLSSDGEGKLAATVEVAGNE